MSVRMSHVRPYVPCPFLYFLFIFFRQKVAWLPISEVALIKTKTENEICQFISVDTFKKVLENPVKLVSQSEYGIFRENA